MRGVVAAGGVDDATRTADRTEAPPPRRGPGELSRPFQQRNRARYEILGEHGRGGLGRVSRARDRELGRDVAIKELILRGDVREVRFLREALITARLEHPGIVPIHEAGRWDDGTPFYAMKLVSGRPLKDLLAARDTLDQRLGLLHHVIAVADAIAYAHGQRIIHRDLKPANVIVGDFGETVVIDWGLAKDLAGSDDMSDEQVGPYRALASNDLTGTGGVIGTPAYMAPEQARGAPVDERVDVFAIGAMLWELCTQTRVPPDDSRQRERALRRAGIDRDLGAIIAKALAPEPAGRYRDAAALAADLKAFQSGARIAARHYSALAALAHWTRRRRRLAISVAAAAVIAIAGAAGFVHDIARERDRADAAAIEARAQQRSAEQARNELALQHAELLLRGDPTAAMAVLDSYRGDDAARLRRLRAEAVGRGVATGMLRPHAEPVRFVAADPGGAIVSLGQDRTLRITQGGRSTTLASNVLVPTKIRYMPGARTVAYATAPTGIAVLALDSRAITSVATGSLRAMDLLRDGTRLAALTRDGTITIWSLAPRPAVIHEERIADAIDLEFATADRLVVQRRDGLRTLWFSPGHRGEAIAIASRDFEVDAERAVISDDQGHIALLSSQLALLSRISVCHRSVTNVDLIPHSELVAFVCEEAIAGVARYDAAARELRVVDTFPTVERPYRIWRDEPGTRIAVADDSNLVYLYDIATRMVTRYDAATQVSRIQLPTRDFDHLLVGDMHGNVRIWDPPRRDARKLLQAPRAVSAVAFDADGSALIASGSDGSALRIDLAGGAVTEPRGHPAAPAAFELSPDGRSLLGRDRDGTARVVFSQPQLLTALAVLRGDRAAVQDAAGAIWEVAPGGAVRVVRAADGASVTVLRASPDGRLLATGTDKGGVVVYDTERWAELASAQLAAGVRQLRFDPRNRDLIAISEDRRVHAVALGTARELAWHDLAMAARNVVYAPDGDTLAFVCTDGGTWFYDVRADRWAYTLDHPSDTAGAAFSPDGERFASSDLRGGVTVRDVAATFAAARAR